MANRLAGLEPIHQAPICDADKISLSHCLVEHAEALEEIRLRCEPPAHADADLRGPRAGGPALSS